MGVELKWMVENHVLFARYYDHVAPQDIAKQYQDGIELTQQSDAQYVHMIVDVAGVKSFPMQLNAYKDSYGEKADNAGWVVIVGNNKLIRFLSGLISSIMNLHMTYVNTMQEAIDYLVERDASLDATKLHQHHDRLPETAST